MTLPLMRLSDMAANRIKDILASSDNPNRFLRIGIEKGGCAGFEYKMEWVDEPGKFDEKIEDKGVTVLIDAKAVLYLMGTEMDYQTEKLSSRFVFNNPNQTSACGCGESIAITPAKPEMAS